MGYWVLTFRSRPVRYEELCALLRNPSACDIADGSGGLVLEVVFHHDATHWWGFAWAVRVRGNVLLLWVFACVGAIGYVFTDFRHTNCGIQAYACHWLSTTRGSEGL